MNTVSSSVTMSSRSLPAWQVPYVVCASQCRKTSDKNTFQNWTEKLRLTFSCLERVCGTQPVRLLCKTLNLKVSFAPTSLLTGTRMPFSSRRIPAYRFLSLP
jgi:hypothetical protein